MRMGLREANQHFSKAVKAVKAGEQVVLTDRGKPIAVIKRLPQAHSDAVEAALDRMAVAGLLRRAGRPRPMTRPRWQPVRIKGLPLSQTLREERDAE